MLHIPFTYQQQSTAETHEKCKINTKLIHKQEVVGMKERENTTR